jgi:Ca2+-binding RTX toxin-like protein
LLRGLRFWIWIQGVVAVAAFGVAVAGAALRRVPEESGLTSVRCLVPAGERVLVVLEGDGAGAAITRLPDGDLVVGGERCVGANLNLVDLVRVVGGPGTQSVTVDLATGFFGPGRTPEGNTTPEAELEIALGEGEDRLTIAGSERQDRIALGASGINLNAGEALPDADVTVDAVELFAVRAGGDADTVTAEGGLGVAEAFEASVEVDGGLGGDSLTGGVGADRLLGSGGRDEVIGGPGDDSLAGGLDRDLVEGGDGDDRLDGGQGDDVVAGGPGSDEEGGGEDDDHLRQDPDDGPDVLFGGPGADAVSYRARTSSVTVTLEGGPDDGEAREGDDVSPDVEGVVGGSGDDALIGSEAANELAGGRGDDLLRGGGGDDVLRGGKGSDSGDYRASPTRVRANLAERRAVDDRGGRDRLVDLEDLVGGFGDDVLVGEGGPNSILGGPGTDRIEGRGGIDQLGGGRADDALNGGHGADVLVGAPGDDRLRGGPELDTAGYDEASAAVTVDLASGEASDGDGGRDKLAGIEAARGTIFGDVLRGGAGSDLLAGGLGDDTLVGRGGDDDLVGGEGRDEADYSGAEGRIEVSLADGEAVDDGDGGADGLRRVEDVVGGPRGDDLRGNGRGNRLAGGGGDDLVSGGGGADDLSGGDGTDSAVYREAPSGVTVNLRRALAPDDGTGTQDTVVSVEGVIGSGFDDAIVGDSFANVLMGGDGDDRLAGGSGGDRLEGRAGDDQLDGSPGFDRCIGGQGVDLLDRCEDSTQ